VEVGVVMRGRQSVQSMPHFATLIPPVNKVFSRVPG
jgi:hypothetical protein